MTCPFIRCYAALALGLLICVAPACADAATRRKVVVQKKNPITREMEWVEPGESFLSRAVRPILKPVTKPAKKVKKALFGPPFKQQGPVPGFGGEISQRQIQAPTGFKPAAAQKASRTASVLGSAVGGREVGRATGRAVHKGVREVIGTGATTAK